MATDYDAPRVRAEDEPADPGLSALVANRGAVAQTLVDDVDPFETDVIATDADLDTSDMTMTVLPKQADEFTCSSCYLVYHRSQRASSTRVLCRDCS